MVAYNAAVVAYNDAAVAYNGVAVAYNGAAVAYNARPVGRNAPSVLANARGKSFISTSLSARGWMALPSASKLRLTRVYKDSWPQ